jgi:hypothetical protein
VNVQKIYIISLLPTLLGGTLADRLQAMAMLKVLVDNDLVEPSYVSMVQVKPNIFQIKIKCDYNKTEIEAHAKKHGLTITEDKERKYLVIFKP